MKWKTMTSHDKTIQALIETFQDNEGQNFSVSLGEGEFWLHFVVPGIDVEISVQAALFVLLRLSAVVFSDQMSELGQDSELQSILRIATTSQLRQRPDNVTKQT